MYSKSSLILESTITTISIEPDCVFTGSFCHRVVRPKEKSVSNESFLAGRCLFPEAKSRPVFRSYLKTERESFASNSSFGEKPADVAPFNSQENPVLETMGQEEAIGKCGTFEISPPKFSFPESRLLDHLLLRFPIYWDNKMNPRCRPVGLLWLILYWLISQSRGTQ
jgi:hypothetical protein